MKRAPEQIVSLKDVPAKTLPSFWKDDKYYVLDQLLLPENIKYIECSSPENVAETIRNMNLRGAPLIGAAGSAAVALYFNDASIPKDAFNALLKMLLETRPTAVNLKNVLEEIKDTYERNSHLQGKELYNLFRSFSEFVHKRDEERNFKMGENGAVFLESLFNGKKLRILTHCNAGALATCGYGTALGVIRSLNRRNLIEHVLVDETRPYLQGSRLTAFEMVSENIPHTVITDSTAAWLMHKKKIDAVITGADRVAANGDLANKIGTYSLAVNAHHHGIPFLAAMPLETFDRNIPDGHFIVIEERNDEELLVFNGKRIAPELSKGLHLGFDVVPVSLVTALVTEKKVLKKDITQEAISGLFNEDS
ncbi:MAG TPA: S-methyl-5-thioribose-1-phosphate isomerase [bacterium]|nr:S-methyl-5-thioribose-1-phosphate isomerase [bacterium]HQB09977.1 S-methyl-5-thioribose-1-phosphate isomerase [bacterium]